MHLFPFFELAEEFKALLGVGKRDPVKRFPQIGSEGGRSVIGADIWELLECGVLAVCQ